MNFMEVFARSKIVLNTHISCASEDASNLRLYEATGMGACLLTDEQPSIAKLFELGSEVVTYRGVDDCVEKVSYLLEHPDEREAIAAAGQRRTLRDHSFTQRAQRLAKLIEQLVGAPTADRQPGLVETSKTPRCEGTWT